MRATLLDLADQHVGAPRRDAKLVIGSEVPSASTADHQPVGAGEPETEDADLSALLETTGEVGLQDRILRDRAVPIHAQVHLHERHCVVHRPLLRLPSVNSRAAQYAKARRGVN